MSDDVLVSAVIPVYNGERFLRETIASVLEQTHETLECVIVDDGSTDTSADIVRSFDDPRVRYVYQKNAGVSAARNRGIDEALGELIAFLDADDVWLPEKVERQVAEFERRPRLGLLVTGYDVVDEALAIRRTVVPDRRQLDMVRLLMLEASGIGLSFTGMVRRDVAAIRFDPSYSTSADLEFALRVGEHHEIDAVLEPVAQYRTHRGQMHLDLNAFEHEVLRLFDEWMAPGSSLSPHRRRALANLYTRLFFYEASRLNAASAIRAVVIVLRTRPDRVVMLPAWAFATRRWHRTALLRVRAGQATGTPRRFIPWRRNHS